MASNSEKQSKLLSDEEQSISTGGLSSLFVKRGDL